MDEAVLENARLRVAEAERRVEAQEQILRGVQDMHGDTTRAEKILRMVEAELAEAQRNLADLEEANPN